MSRFTTTARRAGLAAVVLVALVPAAHATVPHESTGADGTGVVLPEALRADRPSGPLGPVAPVASGAPGAPGAVQRTQAAAPAAIPTVPVAADAGDRAPGRHRTPTMGVGPHSRVPATAPVAADAGDRVRGSVPVSADAPDRVPVAQAPADDGGRSWPTVLLAVLLAAAAAVGIVTVLRRVLNRPGAATPSHH